MQPKNETRRPVLRALLIGTTALCLAITSAALLNSAERNHKEPLLPADIIAKIEQLPESDRQKLLGDALFHQYMQEPNPEVRTQFFDSWVDGLKDNFCREYLTDVASRSFDTAGVKKLDLPTALKGCPSGTSLTETLTYVNTRLWQAFDDPFTAALPPEGARDFKNMVTGKMNLTGVGLVFSAMPDNSDGKSPHKFNRHFNGLIHHVTSGSPAQEAGLEDGDTIVKVNGENVAGKDADYVIGQLIKGADGTSLKFTVLRDGQIFEKTITRRVIDHSDAVWTRKLPGHNGFYAVVVNEWREGVSTEIYNAVLALKNAGARGIVIDLRNNGGGILDEAIVAASFFVRDGVLITTKNRLPGEPADQNFVSVKWERRNGQLFQVSKNESTGEVQEKQLKVEISKVDSKTGKETATQETDVPFLPNMPPVVVLGNGLTASASEVFIGSLAKNRIAKITSQDFQGAPFVGSQTYGKGIAQSNQETPLSTRLSVTTGRYFLSDGTWPGDAYKNRHPLKPDLVAEQSAGILPYAKGDKQLEAAAVALNSLLIGIALPTQAAP